MKKSFVVLVVAISVAICSVATAAVYTLLKARMSVFSGRVEQINNSETASDSGAKLVLKIADEAVGQDASVAVYGGDCFPVLTNVEGRFTGKSLGDAVWTSDEGREPLKARPFVLKAEGGDVEDIVFKIEAKGNATFSSAIRFGLVIDYHGEHEVETALMETASFSMGGEREASSEPILLGDGTIADGEEVTISVWAWVDPYALAGIGEYDEDDILNIEFVFYSLPGQNLS